MFVIFRLHNHFGPSPNLGGNHWDDDDDDDFFDVLLLLDFC